MSAVLEAGKLLHSGAGKCRIVVHRLVVARDLDSGRAGLSAVRRQRASNDGKVARLLDLDPGMQTAVSLQVQLSESQLLP